MVSKDRNYRSKNKCKGSSRKNAVKSNVNLTMQKTKGKNNSNVH